MFSQNLQEIITGGEPKYRFRLDFGQWVGVHNRSPQLQLEQDGAFLGVDILTRGYDPDGNSEPWLSRLVAVMNNGIAKEGYKDLSKRKVAVVVETSSSSEVGDGNDEESGSSVTESESSEEVQVVATGKRGGTKKPPDKGKVVSQAKPDNVEPKKPPVPLAKQAINPMFLPRSKGTPAKSAVTSSAPFASPAGLARTNSKASKVSSEAGASESPCKDDDAATVVTAAPTEATVSVPDPAPSQTMVSCLDQLCCKRMH